MADCFRQNFSTPLGLSLGVVKDLKDPDKRNRIKVMLIGGEKDKFETVYANVASLFAGNDFGAVFIPRVGEQVIVGFLGGQINAPVVLGSVYNVKAKPPLVADKKNEKMMIKFPEGLIIEIDNKKNKQKVTLTTKKGHVLTLDDNKEKIEAKNKSGKTSLAMDLKKGNITIKAEKKISLQAGQDKLTLNQGIKINTSSGDVAIKGKNVKVNAKAKADVKGTAGASLQSNGVTTVKGSLLKQN